MSSHSGEDGTGENEVVLDKFGRPETIHMTAAQRDRILRQLTVPVENLPQPLPWAAPFLQYSLADRVSMALNTAQWRVNRPLEPQEANAFAEMTSTVVRSRGWGVPVWLGATWFMEKRGRRTFRFPWYVPTAGLHFYATTFPHPKMPLINGAAAVRAWHATRFAAYATILYYAIVPFFGFYGEVTAAVRASADQRLKQFNADMTRVHEQRKKGRALGTSSTTSAMRTTSTTPTEQLPPSQDTANSDWPAVQDEQQQQDQQPTQTAPRRAQPSKWSVPAPASRRDEDEAFLFDDASPVAPVERKPQPVASSSSTTSWQQLRDRAKGGDNTWGQEDSQANRAQSGQKAESYSYSDSDRERNYAKEQAQKEFDAMLERERSGKGDNNGRRF